MKKEDFEELKKSVIEAGKVMRGEIAPARETIYKVDKSQLEKSVKTWAICIETDDDELLIPFKVYEIEIFSGGIRVIDEEGEATFCPQEFFLPLSLPQKAERKLENLAQVT
ncbi:hypothetical protein BH20ACI1_BH20ACI1_23540 [soil metagenome]